MVDEEIVSRSPECGESAWRPKRLRVPYVADMSQQEKPHGKLLITGGLSLEIYILHREVAAQNLKGVGGDGVGFGVFAAVGGVFSRLGECEG